MNRSYLLLSLLTILLGSCSKDKEVTPEESKKTIKGVVQKGPFISGTSIQIIELNENLNQTGRTYTTQIINNSGAFSISGIELISPYVCLRADGFYFNEITGEQSTSQITLYALSETSNFASLNVNPITTLIKSRIEYLVGQGLAYSVAKKQSEGELLKIFNITKNDFQGAELLDISVNGEDNAILLAISSILQGYRSESAMTELLSNISIDIREDGILNNSLSGSALINHAVYLDTNVIKTNLQSRYSGMGASATIPPFSKYIQQFIDSTAFQITETVIEFPVSGSYGLNILDLNQTSYPGNTSCSLNAFLPKGTTLKVIIKSTSSTFWYYTGSPVNWTIGAFNMNNYTQVFNAIQTTNDCDVYMTFDPGTYTIEYYEKDISTPTRVKNIVVN
ncbi:MAG: hypothetical protein K8R85_03710 [Bacteroidetes bacterium]|nr:hypothetical protein [Bacteroidota bacterium]